MKNLHLSFDESYIGRIRKKIGNMLFILQCAGVFIEDKRGNILMHQAYGNDDWKLIGGVAEDNESLWQCATREAKEETNLDISNLKPIAFRDSPEFITSLDNGHKIFAHVMYFYCTNYSGELKISQQEEDVRTLGWIDPKDLTTPMSSRTRICFDMFLEYKNTGQFQYITNE